MLIQDYVFSSGSANSTPCLWTKIHMPGDGQNMKEESETHTHTHNIGMSKSEKKKAACILKYEKWTKMEIQK